MIREHYRLGINFTCRSIRQPMNLRLDSSLHIDKKKLKNLNIKTKFVIVLILPKIEGSSFLTSFQIITKLSMWSLLLKLSSEEILIQRIEKMWRQVNLGHEDDEEKTPMWYVIGTIGEWRKWWPHQITLERERETVRINVRREYRSTIWLKNMKGHQGWPL